MSNVIHMPVWGFVLVLVLDSVFTAFVLVHLLVARKR